MAVTSPLVPFIAHNDVCIADGGFGTALQHGVAQKHVMWGVQTLLTASGNAEVTRVHDAFLESGADVIGTNSYKVSYECFHSNGTFEGAFPEFTDAISDEREREQFAHDLLIKSVKLAKESRDKFWERTAVKSNECKKENRLRPVVAASVGPAGDNLQTFTGATDPNTVTSAEDFDDTHRVEQYYRRKLTSLVAAEPDLIALETLPSVQEALIALEVLAEVGPEMPAWVSFICFSKKELASGDNWTASVNAVQHHPNVCAVGLNCTAPHLVADLLRDASLLNLSKPLLAYPNSGEVWDAREGERKWSNEKGKMKVLDGGDAREMHDAGARVIGGCCNVTDTQINLFRSEFDVHHCESNQNFR